MGNVLACAAAFIFGVCFTAGVSFSSLSPAQLENATKLCASNEGVATIRSNMWDDHKAICSNGATFDKFGELK